MNLDKDGLPVQSDGDANDQLNRIGMLLVASYTAKQFAYSQHLINFFHAITTFLQPSPGIYLRHKYGNQRNVSADQLIPILCAWTFARHKTQISRMLRSMLKRFGFAQNIVDGLNGDNEKPKMPDFMFLRAMPLFSRHSSWRYLFDLYLPVLVVSDLLYMRFGKDPADVNCTLVTLLTCSRICPTLTSRASWNLWIKYGKVYERLTRYHRAESGGNPEIAENYKHVLTGE